MQRHYIEISIFNLAMSLDMFTTHDIATAINSSCNKNEQKRRQALFSIKIV
jgi:hypothetical protein